MARVAGYLMSPDPAPDTCDCMPPSTGPGLMTSAPIGSVWLCEHQQRGWEVAADTSPGYRPREWRELTGRRLRRASRRAIRRGYVKTDRETWAPSQDRPTPPVDS